MVTVRLHLNIEDSNIPKPIFHLDSATTQSPGTMMSESLTLTPNLYITLSLVLPPAVRWLQWSTTLPGSKLLTARWSISDTMLKVDQETIVIQPKCPALDLQQDLGLEIESRTWGWLMDFGVVSSLSVGLMWWGYVSVYWNQTELAVLSWRQLYYLL